MKQRAEDVLGEPIDAVTLGRPVKFSESPEQDHKAQETLRQAAQEAGFKEVDFELEPIAAALDYEQSMTKPQNVVIFDFGGGTLDIAVMRLGDPHKREVYASGGVDIAGSDFDRAIIEKRMLSHFGYGRVKHHPGDPGNDPRHPRLDGAPRTGYAHQQKHPGESHSGRDRLRFK